MAIINKILNVDVRHWNYFSLLVYLEEKDELDALIIAPNKGLCFPASDIRRVDRRGTHSLRLLVSFMGLYGNDSPLPHYFLTQQRNHSIGLCPLVTVLTQRIYKQYFEAWSNNHFWLPLARTTRRGFDYLSLLSGGLINNAPKCLQTFLLRKNMGYFDENQIKLILGRVLCCDVAIKTAHSPRWAGVAVHEKLGSKTVYRLGSTALLGERILLAKQITLEIKILNENAVDQKMFLQQFNRKWLELSQWLFPLDSIFVIHIVFNVCDQAGLAKMACYLGINTFLGCPAFVTKTTRYFH